MSIPVHTFHFFEVTNSTLQESSYPNYQMSVSLILSNANTLHQWTDRAIYTLLTSFWVLTRLIHYADTLTISHNVHCCDNEVDVGPQVWKHVLPQVTGITTSICHINGSALSTDVTAHNITGYIWLHCSYVEGCWRIPFEKLMVTSKWDDLEVMTLSQFTCGAGITQDFIT